MANKTSPHILGSCTNLMGFCLLLITSLHISDNAMNTQVDEFTALVALLLTISSILSFIAIRTKKERVEHMLERVAEWIYVLSMIAIGALFIFILFSF